MLDSATYVTQIFDPLVKSNPQVLMYDEYPFEFELDNKDCPLDGKFFSRRDQTFRIFARKSAELDIPFWTHCVSSVTHGKYDTNTFEQKMGRNYTNFQLHFSAHYPLIYGSKGIGYFTYDTPGNPMCENTPRDQKKYPRNPMYSDALLDFNGNKTDRYYEVQAINAELQAMGPTLMNLKWITTVHGSERNAYDRYENPIPPLPTIFTAAFPVLEKYLISDENSSFAVGIFEQLDNSNINYLIVMNKDIGLSRSHNYQLKSVETYIVEEFNSEDGSWSVISTSDMFDVTLRPGDIKLLRLFLE